MKLLVVLGILFLGSVAFADDPAAPPPQMPESHDEVQARRDLVPKFHDCVGNRTRNTTCVQFRSSFPKLKSESFNGKTPDQIVQANTGLNAYYPDRMSTIAEMANCIDDRPMTMDEIKQSFTQCQEHNHRLQGLRSPNKKKKLESPRVGESGGTSQ